MPFDSIPVFARFQWLNSVQVVDVLTGLLKPKGRGRKGYGSVVLFRWLMAKWLMRMTYRDLESMSGIDHSTFIKFRKRLMASFCLREIFETLATGLASRAENLRLIMDSSFVETYSRHDELGSEYNGHKEKNGFKVHAVIDFKRRLPVLQIATPGARSDFTLGRALIERAPPEWKVRSLAADKGYDSEALVSKVKQKWKRAKVAIPLRKTSQEKRTGHPENWYNRFLKSLPRSWNPKLYRERTEIERYFSRKKNVFRLGEEKTRGFRNFEANCYLTSIMEYLEYIGSPRIMLALFTKLITRYLTISTDMLCFLQITKKVEKTANQRLPN